MHEQHLPSAEQVRGLVRSGQLGAAELRASLASTPIGSRDAWVDSLLELEVPPEDGPELPRGCVPYLPCSVDVLLRLSQYTELGPADVFVDIGAGVGRAATLVHLLTGASSVGLEVQPSLVRAARQLTARLQLSSVSFVEGDACERPEAFAHGSVFLLYCPFSGERLGRLLSHLEAIAQRRTLRVCCVDVPLPLCSWLELAHSSAGDLSIYRSREPA